jgi:hypothetical protein
VCHSHPHLIIDTSQGGGTPAYKLALSGKKILLLERAGYLGRVGNGVWKPGAPRPLSLEALVAMRMAGPRSLSE